MRRKWSIQGGFTSAELLVAIMIAAMVVGTAALAFGTLSRGQRQFTTAATITLPSGAQNNFFGINSNTITAHVAPNLGAVAQAEGMRERFHADVAQSIGVYCLYRDDKKWNTYRPTTIPTPAFGTAMDTAEAFRLYLKSSAISVDLYKSYRNTSDKSNFSIFILGYSTDATTIPVLAVYDLDMVDAKDPSNNSQVGTYAALRRYSGGVLTAYYDVLYRDSGQTESWAPAIVAFERKSRLARTENTDIDRFKVAAGRPFYLVFWPDPAADSLAIPSDARSSGTLNGNYLSSDPRREYNHMAGRTSFMFTVPMFPSS